MIELSKIDPEEMLTPPVFSALVAYLGEVMRNSSGGHWEMHPDRDREIWTPMIVDVDGISYSPARIIKELVERGKSVSTLVFVQGTLGAKKLIMLGRRNL